MSAFRPPRRGASEFNALFLRFTAD